MEVIIMMVSVQTYSTQLIGSCLQHEDRVLREHPVRYKYPIRFIL